MIFLRKISDNFNIMNDSDNFWLASWACKHLTSELVVDSQALKTYETCAMIRCDTCVCVYMCFLV